MTRRSVARLTQMGAAEIGWRLQTSARTMIDRAATGVITPRWKRDHLGSALAPLPGLEPARAALARRDWNQAHRELSRYFAHAPQRFVSGHTTKGPLLARIRSTFPHSERHAAARADRILAGEYDLLGYRGLRFDPPCCGAGGHGIEAPRHGITGVVDWSFDPVHERHAPRIFWSTVPYLEPACGDHKIIWELNRHQHWLTLGRAFWLTGDTKYRDRFVAELTGWIGANPPLVGINWASMLELAFRSVSWLWALSFFVEDPATEGHSARTEDAPPWTVDLLLALDRQLTHIERNLSHYFSPNTHLSGEALALYVSGWALPELSASARRRDVGRRVLLAEIDRQIAPDGGHYERSTHYHRYTLDFYLLALLVARINHDPAAVEFERVVSRLAFAARLLADDRGRIPHIGDDDGGALLPMTGRAPDDLRGSLAVAAALVHRPYLRVGRIPEEALWLLAHDAAGAHCEPFGAGPDTPRSRLTSAALVETGYYVSRTASSDHLVIDGGPHGYQNGGHAHADALSLTFSVRGVPLLIDPGTGGYTADRALRDRFRSTALHNTLTLDDRPQSVANGPFHWSHTANGCVRCWRTNEGFDYFDGAHDGYQPIAHRRHVLALHDDLLIVADLMDGPGTHTTAAHWHIDPHWRTDVGGRRATFTYGEEAVSLVVPEGVVESFSADANTGLGWHSPVYGRVERATTLRVARHGTTPLWMVSVFALHSENAVADVEWLPVGSDAGPTAQAIAIRISRADSIDYLLIADAATNPDPNAARGTLLVGDLETDARMLFYRSTPQRVVSRLALVDGSIVRAAGCRRFHLDLHAVVPDYFADFDARDQERTEDHGRTKNQDPRTKDQTTCVASPAS